VCNKKAVEATTKDSVGSVCGLRIDIGGRLHRMRRRDIDAVRPEDYRLREEIL